MMACPLKSGVRATRTQGTGAFLHDCRCAFLHDRRDRRDRIGLQCSRPLQARWPSLSKKRAKRSDQGQASTCMIFIEHVPSLKLRQSRVKTPAPSATHTRGASRQLVVSHPGFTKEGQHIGLDMLQCQVPILRNCSKLRDTFGSSAQTTTSRSTWTPASIAPTVGRRHRRSNG